jgi:hypothetical protein
MLTRQTLAAAAFWQQDICIDCGTVQDTPPNDLEAELTCEVCGSDTLLVAELGVRLLERLAESEESEDAP